jgi:hypothetical protein
MVKFIWDNSSGCVPQSLLAKPDVVHTIPICSEQVAQLIPTRLRWAGCHSFPRIFWGISFILTNLLHIMIRLLQLNPRQRLNYGSRRSQRHTEDARCLLDCWHVYLDMTTFASTVPSVIQGGAAHADDAAAKMIATGQIRRTGEND